jgi:OOP family OmpA-OmpF porin
MKNFTIIFIVILVSASAVSGQVQQGKNINPLSTKIGFGLEGGATFTKSDFSESDFDFYGRFITDFYFPTTNDVIFGLTGMASFGYLAGSGTYANISSFPTIPEFRTRIFLLAGGLSFTVTSIKFMYPYALARLGYMNFTPQDKDGNELPRFRQNLYSPNEWFANGEIGIKFPLSEYFTFNLSGAMYYYPADNLDDVPNAVSNGTDKDIFFTFTGGFQYYLGGERDIDNDGIRDRDDLCPDTPPEVRVNEFGCPVDSDNDNVPDYLDQCPGTQANILVDAKGCPVDSDEDGIPDYLDLCKETPRDVFVDERGCPKDSDDDGVPDFKDLCPNTPVGTEVNKWGCEVKQEVVEPITKTEYVVSSGANFEIGKAGLLPVAFAEFDKILKLMIDHPETKWRIEGYTDNTGSYELNKDLSLRRARSVYNYFTSKGIKPERLTVYGYGPDRPVADNFTETGRALNRRVSILLIKDGDDPITEQAEAKSGIYNNSLERNIGQMIFTDGNLYCFQVSSWRLKSKAESEAEKLLKSGLNAFITTANLTELDGTWYRVRVGYFNSLDETKRVKSLIK